MGSYTFTKLEVWIIKNGHQCSPGEPVNKRSLKEVVDKMNGQKPTVVIKEEIIH